MDLDDEFCFNDRFASKLRRVKVPLISNKSKAGRVAAPGGASAGPAGDTGGTRSGSGGTGAGGLGAQGAGAGGGTGVGGVSDAVEESRRHLYVC